MTKCAPKSSTAGSLRHCARITSAALVIAFALEVTSVAQPAAGRPVQQPIEGWPMAKWGMTEPEVLKAFGGAAKSLNEGTPPGTELTATIGIDDVGVGGIYFRALFLFDETGKLERIRLYGPAPSSTPEGQFRKVEDYLAGKYGEPFSGIRGDNTRSLWILQRTVIELNYYPMTALYLSFEMRNGQTNESVMSGFAEAHRKHARAIEQSIQLPAGNASGGGKSEGAGQFGKWRVTKSKSQFDDSPTVVLALKAENTIRGWLATSIPVLLIRCQERKTEVYVATGMQASVESGGTSLHTVRLRYGDEAAYVTPMSESTDNKSLFFIDLIGDIRRMWNVQPLLVGFTPFNANPVTIRFDVSGLPLAIQPLREACGW